MGWIILLTYLVGLALTWVIAYALIYKEEKGGGGPIEDILMSGMLSLCIAMFWPVVILAFGVHRIATAPVRGREEGSEKKS